MRRRLVAGVAVVAAGLLVPSAAFAAINVSGCIGAPNPLPQFAFAVYADYQAVDSTAANLTGTANNPTAPSASPTSWSRQAGVQTSVEAP